MTLPIIKELEDAKQLIAVHGMLDTHLHTDVNNVLEKTVILINELEKRARAGACLAEDVKEFVSPYCASLCGCDAGNGGHDGQCRFVTDSRDEMQRNCLLALSAYNSATRDITSKEKEV